MTAAKIGIIGGSGLYQMPELTEIDELEIQTPFGSPSDKFILGTLEGERVAFLPRHGVGHRFTPTEVPFRANIYGMKLLGVERILSRSEEHTSELQSRVDLVCRLLLEKK